MTKLREADVVGNIVEWTDEDGTHKAKIDYRIRDGATSSVYRARELLEENALQHDWAVKIPFSVSETDSEFCDEIEVVKKLRHHYISNGLIPPLPSLKIVPFLDRNVIIIEFVRVQWQLIARCEEQEFLSHHYFGVMKQIVQLYGVLHSLGVANLDIKDENFYWHPDNRLVVLDWNRCIQNEPENSEKSTRFTTAVSSGYRVLANLFFQFYTGKEAPNPLPLTADSEWGPPCPRSIRRTVLDASTPWVPDDRMILDRLEWQEKIIDAISSRKETDLFRDCQRLHETSEIDLSERIERIQDAIASLNLSAHRDEFVQELREESDWVHYILSKSDLKLNDAIQQIRRHLENYDVSLALQTGLRHLDEMSRPDQVLLRSIHWKLARWTWICELFVQLSNLSEINIDNYKRQIPLLLDLFGDESIPTGINDESASLLLQPDINRACALVSQAENLKSEMLQSYKLSRCREKLQAARQLRLAVNELKDSLPLQVFDALEKFLPIWDVDTLEAEVLREEEAGKLERASLQLRDQVTEILSRGEGDTVLNLEKAFNTSGVPLDDELERIDKAIKEVGQKRWRQAHDIIFSKQPITEFLDAVWTGIHSLMMNSLSEYRNRTLYEPDLMQLAEIRLLASELPDLKLNERLALAGKASTNLIGDLEKCKEFMLEPWASGPRDQLLLVDQFLFKARMENQATELRALKDRLSSEVHDIKTILPTENETDTYLRHRQDAQNRLEEIEKLNQEFAEVQQQHSELYQKILDRQPLHNMLLERTRDAQSKLDAMKREEQNLKNLLAQLEQVIAENQHGLPFAGEASLLIQLVVSLLQKSDFKMAMELLDQGLRFRDNATGTMPVFLHGFKELVMFWRTHIQQIGDMPPVKAAYVDWFESLNKHDLQRSQGYLGRLKDDQGKPVYEYLLQRHALLTHGKGWRPEDNWSEMFSAGKISELEKEIDAYEISSSYDQWLKNQWEHRLYLYRFACEYRKKVNGRRAKKEMDFLHLIIPAEIWQAVLLTLDSRD